MSDLTEPFLHYDKDDDIDNEDMEKEIASKIREGFIFKVYGIISYQMILTSLIVYLGLVSTWFQGLLLKSSPFFFINVIITFTCLFLPIFSPQVYQKVPLNYIILTLFTFSYSCIISAETCLYSQSSVMVALLLTVITVLTLTYYARTTKKDFTVSGGTLLVCTVLLIVSGIIFMLIRIPFSNLLIIYGSLVLFSIYLIYDTQLLIGKGRMKFSEDDYILAAINIYLDIIVLFLKILRIFGEKKNSNNI